MIKFRISFSGASIFLKVLTLFCGKPCVCKHATHTNGTNYKKLLMDRVTFLRTLSSRLASQNETKAISFHDDMEVEPQMNHISLSKYLTMTKGPPPEMAELQKIEVPQMVQLARPKNSRK